MTFNDFIGTSVEPVLTELRQIAKDEGINDYWISYRNAFNKIELDWGWQCGRRGGTIILPGNIGTTCKYLTKLSDDRFDMLFPPELEEHRKIFGIFRDKLKQNIFMQLRWY